MRKAHQKIIVRRMIKSQYGKPDNFKRTSFLHHGIRARDLEFLTSNEKSYSFFNGFIILRQSVYAVVLTLILLAFMIMERFCFLTIVYKTKCTNYVLIVFVTLINTFILMVSMLKRRKKVEKKMHFMFELETVQSPPCFAIFFVGLLDMSYAFCLFWPANVLPIFVLVCQMQLFIPLNTLLGRCCCARPEYKKHILIAFLIITGAVLSFVSYVKDIEGTD